MTQDDKRKRLALVGITAALVIGVLFVARGALFPFVLSGVIAYLLYPVVRTLESWMPWRNRWRMASRVASVLLIYVVSIAVLAGALAIIVPPAFRQSTEFVDALPELFDRARATVEGWSDEYTARVPEGVREQIEKSLESSGSILIGASRAVLTRTVGAVSNVLTAVIGLAVVPFMVFYLLKDRGASVDGFYSLLPPDARRHARNVLAIANQVLTRVDRAIQKAAGKNSVTYTRYADDLTFSGNDHSPVRLLPFVEQVVGKLGYRLDPKKTNLFRRGRRQCVTGLVVNVKPNLAKPLRRRLRAAVHHFISGKPMSWHDRSMNLSQLLGRLGFLSLTQPEEASRLREKLSAANIS